MAILDADKEGYLRSHRSLIQTAGRAARHVRGRVIFYGDVITESMRLAIDETARRRRIQADYNQAHGIVPESVRKEILPLEYAAAERDYVQLDLAAESQPAYAKGEAVEEAVHRLELEMKAAAKELEFERAAVLRNRIRELRMKDLVLKDQVRD